MSRVTEKRCSSLMSIPSGIFGTVNLINSQQKSTLHIQETSLF